MSDEVAQVEALRKRIEGAKTKRDQLEGERKGLIAQLKELGCTSIKDAKTLVEKLTTETETLREELATGLTELTEMVEELGC